ncbi:MAG: sulfatase-like hydrolase/transferase [Burkholderiaceae bacterium]
MVIEGSKSTRALPVLAGLACFSGAFVLVNFKPLLFKVYYRLAAAHDPWDAALNAGSFALQALMLLLAVTLLPPAAAVVLLVLASVSALVHLSYEQVLGVYLDQGGMSWMLSETRQLGPALLQFSGSFALAAIKTIVFCGLLLLARHMFRRGLPHGWHRYTPRRWTAALCILLVIALPAQVTRAMRLPLSSETSIYAMTASTLTERYPGRTAVLVKPEPGRSLAKIVWLVDESVAYGHFRLAVGSHLERHGPIDFGETASMGNCSSPSNAALRWGIDVARVDASTDLRATPSIWGFAKVAGYRTTLIDGQVSGAPQNMVFAPERALIDSFVAARAGIDTDRSIAVKINGILTRPGRDFIYAVLRGAHYAYESNYPPGLLANATVQQKYVAAISYSKHGFFDAVLSDVDRQTTAVFYTSDHGQDLTSEQVPHCSIHPKWQEFAVPLIAFLPPASAASMASSGRIGIANARHSHSQIFSTTLWLMGYDRHFAEQNYDSLLDKAPKAFVWFGRRIVPGADGEPIELHRGDHFPGSLSTNSALAPLRP